MKLLATAALTLSLFTGASFAEDMSANSSLLDIQHRWAQANYQLEDEKEKIAAFEKLIADAENLTQQSPENAEYWIWLGISKSTFAGVKGGLGALGYAKEAKKALEKALELDPQALNGSAYTSLGTLFHKVPGWPIGFGSDKKAEKMLKKALEINPNGIDPNYFYGEFLYNDGEYQAAKKHLMMAKAAAPRPTRPLADSGRQEEIDALMRKLQKKLNR
ncbi:tetratricopeptide repeat protein [Alteromonas sp. a30]|uniref:tetratricopeptide repeat protein n=1 Tax=Alteromonas sp. a30 TaxID=2730917 RepID=UPI0022832946|nr:hypothetical protein [Alteromonas sp. a30]MCY7295535.1 hypothetical protein [Alteromonas sp. a30]